MVWTIMQAVYYPCSDTPICVQLKAKINDREQWSADTWWRESEMSKAWERFHWHVKNHYPVGGNDVRLVRYLFDVIG